MSKLYLLLAILFNVLVFAQLERKDILSGEITLVNGYKIKFKDLTWKENKAYFHNVTNEEDGELYEGMIKSIEEMEVVPDEERTASAKAKIYRVDYPNGIYATMEEFLNKTPSSNPELKPQNPTDGYYRTQASELETSAFFVNAETKTRIRNVFAVVQNGILYFNIGQIIKNREKEDRGQHPDYPNLFVRVTNGGSNYLYAEALLGNNWGKAFAGIGSGILMGGYAGSAIGSSVNTIRGIIWDIQKKQFNIFKNCEDFNNFIKPISSEDVQECKGKHPDILKVRTAIDKIK